MDRTTIHLRRHPERHQFSYHSRDLEWGATFSRDGYFALDSGDVLFYSDTEGLYLDNAYHPSWSAFQQQLWDEVDALYVAYMSMYPSADVEYATTLYAIDTNAIGLYVCVVMLVDDPVAGKIVFIHTYHTDNSFAALTPTGTASIASASVFDGIWNALYMWAAIDKTGLVVSYAVDFQFVNVLTGPVDGTLEDRGHVSACVPDGSIVFAGHTDTQFITIYHVLPQRIILTRDLATGVYNAIAMMVQTDGVYYFNGVLFTPLALPVHLPTRSVLSAGLASSRSYYWDGGQYVYHNYYWSSNALYIYKTDMISLLSSDPNDPLQTTAYYITGLPADYRWIILGVVGSYVYMFCYYMYGPGESYIYRIDLNTSTASVLHTISSQRWNDTLLHLPHATHAYVAMDDRLLIFNCVTETYELRLFGGAYTPVSIVLDSGEIIALAANGSLQSLGTPEVGQPLSTTLLAPATAVAGASFPPYCIGAAYSFRYSLHNIFAKQSRSGISESYMTSHEVHQSSPGIIFTSYDKSQERTIQPVPMLKSG